MEGGMTDTRKVLFQRYQQGEIDLCQWYDEAIGRSTMATKKLKTHSWLLSENARADLELCAKLVDTLRVYETEKDYVPDTFHQALDHSLNHIISIFETCDTEQEKKG
jgi:hypothetical protein